MVTTTMFLPSITLLVFIVESALVREAKSAASNQGNSACAAWNNLRQVVQNLGTVDMFVCNVDADCMGIGCTCKCTLPWGKTPSKPSKATFEARLQHECQKPVNLLVNVSVPAMDINWTHTFIGSETIMLPAIIGVGDPQIRVTLQMMNEDHLILGASLIKANGDHIMPPDLAHLTRNQTIALPPCSSNTGNRPSSVDTAKRNQITPDNESKVVLGMVTSDGQSCDVSVLGGCGQYETCEQIDPGRPQGACKCRPHYHRDVHGACTADPTVPSSTVDPSAAPNGKNVDDGKDGSLEAFEIGAAIFAVTIVLTLLFVSAYKYRWIPRIRARFQQARTYEEMVIDGDDFQTNNSTSHVVA